MTTTTTSTGLTREHLKALRNAHDIIVRFHGEHFQYHDGKEPLPHTFADCKKEVDPGDGYGKRELHVEVPLEPARFVVYTERSATEGDVANSRTPVSHALWILHSRWNDSPEYTLVHHILRVGDRVTPVWVCNNNSENVRNAGLTVDEFRVEIMRGPVDEPSKCKRLVVLLDTVAIPPHSSARNVTWATGVAR
jgi:hypothetical protein